MPRAKAKVMLVDDHAVLRYGMAMLINIQPDMEVSAEAGDGEEAMAILRVGHHPDIISMDVSLKTCSGLDVIRAYTAKFPHCLCSLYPCMTKQFMRSAHCLPEPGAI